MTMMMKRTGEKVVKAKHPMYPRPLKTGVPVLPCDALTCRLVAGTVGTG